MRLALGWAETIPFPRPWNLGGDFEVLGTVYSKGNEIQSGISELGGGANRDVFWQNPQRWGIGCLCRVITRKTGCLQLS